MSENEDYVLSFSYDFARAVKKFKKNKPDVIRELLLYFPRLERNPELGKPMRNKLRGYRRLHIASSFILLYEIQGQKVRLIDFDHHDRIYKKYS